MLAKYEKGQETLIQTIIYSQYIGMEFGVKKRNKTEGIELINLENIRTLV